MKMSKVLRDLSVDLTNVKQHELSAQVSALITAAEKQDKAGTLKEVITFLKSEWKELKAVMLVVSKLRKKQLAGFIKTAYFEKMKPLIQMLAVWGINLSMMAVLYVFLELVTKIIEDRTKQLTASDLPFANLSEVKPKDVFIAIKRMLIMPKAHLQELVKNAKQELVKP